MEQLMLSHAIPVILRNNAIASSIKTKVLTDVTQEVV